MKSASTSGQGIHLSAKQDYPQAEPLPLPPNIDVAESMRFSPQRARDITSTTIATTIWNQRSIDITIDSSQFAEKSSTDPHVNSYDCSGAVSLNSSMQSNVPSPFGGMHKFTHLNMPGGQWSQSSKWMSQDLHSSHYTNLRREVRQNMLQNELKSNGSGLEQSANEQGMKVLKNNACLHGNSASKSNSVWMHMMRSNYPNGAFVCLAQTNHFQRMFCHLNASSNQTIHRMFSDKKEQVKPVESKDKESSGDANASEQQTESVALTPRTKLKNAIKDYGSTVIVFHVAISLVSLGIFYQLVSRYVTTKNACGDTLCVQCSVILLEIRQ